MFEHQVEASNTEACVAICEKAGTSMNEVRQRISKAYTSIILTKPFFGYFAVMLEPIIIPCGTAFTNGRIIGFDPRFVHSCTDAEMVGLIAHECLHVMLKHHLRRENRLPRKWNVACDHAINLSLLEDNFQLPKKGLHDPRYEGMAAEKIYDILPERDSSGGGGGGAGSFGPGTGVPQIDDWGAVIDASDDDGNPLNDAQVSIQSHEIDAMNKRAMKVAEMAGKTPHHIKRLIEINEEPQIQWTDQLAAFAQRCFGNPREYTYARPSMTIYSMTGGYAPSTYDVETGEIVCFIDGSGSVSDAEQVKLISQINGMIVDLRPSKVHLVWYDTAIHHVDEYGPNDHISTVTRRCSGGTSFSILWPWLEKNAPDAVMAVNLTDMGASDWGVEPHCPVMWVSTSKHYETPPFGEVTVLR